MAEARPFLSPPLRPRGSPAGSPASQVTTWTLSWPPVPSHLLLVITKSAPRPVPGAGPIARASDPLSASCLGPSRPSSGRYQGSLPETQSCPQAPEHRAPPTGAQNSSAEAGGLSAGCRRGRVPSGGSGAVGVLPASLAPGVPLGLAPPSPTSVFKGPSLPPIRTPPSSGPTGIIHNDLISGCLI